MRHATISLPAQGDLASILGFARDLDCYVNHDKLVVDFGEQRFFSPFAMLFMASKFKSLRVKNLTQRLEPKGHRAHTYLAHMG